MIRNLNVKQDLNQFEHFEALKNIGTPKEALELLSKIQVGDILTGHLLSQQDNKILMLKNGLQLLACLEGEIEDSHLQDFLVTGKHKGQILLKVSENREDRASSVSFSSEVIDRLNLRNEPEMKSIIEQFMSKQLPLVKNQLTQFFYLAKEYDFPSEALVNLMEQNHSPKEAELKLFGQMKEEGIKSVFPSLEQMVDRADAEKCSQLMRMFLDVVSPGDMDKLLREVGTGFVREDQGKEISNLDAVLEEWLKEVPAHELKKLCKTAVYRLLTLDVKSLKSTDSDEIEKMTETAERLRKIVQVFQEEEMEGTSASSKLEESIQTLEKYRQEAQYFCFPLLINDKETAGELYFFKPKKNRLGSSQGMYIVLALQLPALKQIEIHLMEKEDKIYLKLKIANEEIKNIFTANEAQIRDEFTGSALPIEKIEYELLADSVKKQQTDSVFNHMDFRV